MHIEHFRGTNSVECGVEIEIEEDGERLPARLLPFGTVFAAHIDVPAPVRSALVDGNEALIKGVNIDYGFGEDLGRGTFEQQSAMVDEAMKMLGLVLGSDYLRTEYSGVLCGPGAIFHIDDGFGSPGVLFVVTSALGRGFLSAPQIEWATEFGVGKTVIFDDLQAHGLCETMRGPAGACPFVAVAAEVPLTMAGCKKLGLVRAGEQAMRSIPELNRSCIDAKTGAYTIQDDELAFL